MYFDGRLGKPIQEDRILQACKFMIAEALRRDGESVGDEGVLIDEDPKFDNETYSLLMNETLENPLPARYLSSLKGVWSVKGRHKLVPNKQVDVLIGQYRTVPGFAILGKRDGLSWVSPISLRE